MKASAQMETRRVGVQLDLTDAEFAALKRLLNYTSMSTNSAIGKIARHTERFPHLQHGFGNLHRLGEIEAIADSFLNVLNAVGNDKPATPRGKDCI